MFSYYYDTERNKWIVTGGDGLEYGEYENLEDAQTFCSINNWQ